MESRSVRREDLDAAVQDKVITPEQAEALWHRWAPAAGATGADPGVRARFDFAHLAYYLGALLVISAMGWFMTEAWTSLGGWGLAPLALVYAVLFIAAGRRLYFVEGLKIPGGLLFTVAVSMTPLFVFGVQDITGLWPQGSPGEYRDYYVYVRGSWVVMEVCTMAAGLVALTWVRFPFLTAPVAFAAWFLSMDLTPLLSSEANLGWDARRQVSTWFGLAMLAVAYGVDRRTREDFAFWLYLFGLAAFWGGISTRGDASEIGWLVYLVLNVMLLAAAVLLQRRAFLVFGAIGTFIYVAHLAYEVFEDSLGFPFSLTLVGLAIIFGGVQLQRHSAALERRWVDEAPDWLRRFLPAHRR
jgi:hypothetical protein